MKTMEGKVALVTGAAQGIGFAAAKAFAEAGASVVLSDLEGEMLDNAVQKYHVTYQMRVRLRT